MFNFFLQESKLFSQIQDLKKKLKTKHLGDDKQNWALMIPILKHEIAYDIDLIFMDDPLN